MDNQPHQDSEKKVTIYYDGSCPMCRVITNTIDTSSRGTLFSIQDANQAPLPDSLTREQTEKEIHVMVDGKIYKNIEAILKILEEYPRWNPFIWIARLPLIKQILTIGYRLVAFNRQFLFGPLSRIYWLKITLCLSVISGLLLSLKLWINSRIYPLTPVVDVFPPIPYPIDCTILYVLLGLIATILISSKPRLFIWTSVILVSILVFLDQQRLQPWVYQYVCMLALLGLFSWKQNDLERKEKILNTCRLIIAGIYFWSGLQKLNPEFIQGIFPWLISPILKFIPDSLHTTIHDFGIFVPLIEMSIGIGLVTKRFRTISIWLTIGMAIFILWVLGPLGHDINNVIWPWNIAMVVFVLLLFSNTKSVLARQILWVKNFTAHKIILILFGILPLFYFFNVWDSYLSWSLYSGTVSESVIYLNNNVQKQLPNDIKEFIRFQGQDQSILTISSWASVELNVPPYPEERIFKNVARTICKFTNNSRDVELVILSRKSWFFRDEARVLNCLELSKSNK